MKPDKYLLLFLDFARITSGRFPIVFLSQEINHFDQLKKISNAILLIILFFLCQASVIADWVNVTNEITEFNINALTATGNYVFAGSSQYVYKSSNNGNNWQQVYDLSALALASNGGYIYRGYQNGYNYSTNYGANWLFADLNMWVTSLLANGSYVYAGCFYPLHNGNNGVWVSTNYGANWTQSSLNNIDIYALTVSGGYLFATGYSNGIGGGIYSSTNNGQSWTNCFPISGDALASNGNLIFMGGGGVYLSTNYGANWVQTSLNSVGVHALAVYGNNVFAGSSYGVYVSTDNGASWVQRNEGMGTTYVISTCIYNNFIFIGTSGQGVWRRQLSELVEIRSISSNVPEQCKLYQNYPNPFNPATEIKFGLPKSAHVTIRVFDILGKQIAVLANNEFKHAGQYSVTFDGSNYASGIYIYRIETHPSGSATEDFTDSKKMVLIK